jgi:UDP-glucoronosyl and UDP-glucosyl transferase.
VSQIFKDRPMTPLQTAIFWTEYVLRHRGAPHLRSAGADLPWHQYLLLDVIITLILILLCSLIIMYLFLKAVISLFCSVSKKQKVKTK